MRARAILAAAGLALAAEAGAQDAARLMTAAEYRQELSAIDAALAASDLASAAARGEGLRAAQIQFGDERVRADPGLAAAVAAVTPRTVPAVRARVRAVRRGLEREAAPPAPADRDLLRRAMDVERVAAIRAGGQVAGLPLRPSLPRRFLDAAASAWRSFVDALERFLRWLERNWPRRVRPAAGGAGTRWTVAVLVVAIAAVLGLLAVAALRRSAPAAQVASEPEAASERDADPLSREQDEWEAYAAELAAAGRTREAIRAWYHAVLVALFRAGVLHHHKGRTNWEYVTRVPPAAPWRPELIGLTRRFDREWYGRDRSSPESLRECASDARSILRQVRMGVAA